MNKYKQNKRLLIGLFLIIIMSIALGFGYKAYLRIDYINNINNKEDNKEFSLIKKVDIKEQPIHLHWIDNNLIIDTEKSTYKYEPKTDKISKILSTSEYHISGAIDNKKVYITWVNKLITQPTENATVLYIYNFDKKLIKKIPLRQTIRPIEIQDNKIILIDNYPNSPNRKWIYNIKTNKLLIYKTQTTLITINDGDFATTITYKKNKYVIPPNQIFVDLKVNESSKDIAFIDSHSNVWIVKPIIRN